MSRGHPRETGSALILAAVVVIITAGLGAAFMTLAYTQNRATFNASISETALYIAEAGLEDALNRMNAYASAAWAYVRANNLSEPTGYTPPTGADFNCFFTTYDYVAGQTPIAKSALVRPGAYPGTPGYNQFPFNGGTYSVEIVPAFDGSRRAYTVKATGRHGNTSRRIETVVDPEDVFTLDGIAAFGDLGLDISGNLFADSYKSSLGTYASQKGGKAYARDKAILATNGTLSLKGNSYDVFGAVYTGPGQIPPSSSRVTVGVLPERIPVPPQCYSPTQSTYNDSLAGNWNKDMILGTSGTDSTYRFSSMTHRNKIEIRIRGNVTIYVDGEIDMHAQSYLYLEPGATLKIYQGPGNFKMVLNGGSKWGGGDLEPYRFQFYSSSSGDITFNGHHAAFGSFYAPYATVKQNGNAEIFGKVVFKQIDKMTGSFCLHFDEDLNPSPQSAPVYKVRSWREALQ